MKIEIKNLKQNEAEDIMIWIECGFIEFLKNGEYDNVDWIHKMCHIVEEVKEQVNDERNV